ncbi:GvpL/GvpF family gas vesicle protein [Cognatiyoonia sp. IB215446]|uniref:GvpL/GvpF family gas vesicle protein n=1 Tax=Cognatiyoonia sp. IB215446 TaxID=3097355 RepID=UPI002A157411|nr:GvpL/GvpF family gas vesicle protein [Cognatiyoonia sp. IB215446]MDX8348468.1 GvpL/GvpF family gas vesicle protein [Cognatiyoonia sp. IB215446]
MKNFELYALTPRTSKLPKVDGLQYLHMSTYSAIMSVKAQKAMALPKSRQQILSAAAMRQAQLEKCMEADPLIICRPQFFISQEHLPGLVSANRPLLDRLGARLKGKVQYQITVNWNEEAVLDKFRDSPELRGLFKKRQVTPTTLARSTSELRKRLVSQIETQLSRLSDQVIDLPAMPDMLFNAVILLARAQIPELDAAVEAVDDIWTEGFQIKQIGPAPAASFALLDPKPIDAGEIDAALKHLDLQRPLDESTVARARRETLLNVPQQADYTKRCAEIAAAMARAGNGPRLFLCDVSAEDQAALTNLRKVA